MSKAYVKPGKTSHRLMAILHKVKQKLNLLPASEQPKSVIEKQRKALLKKAHEAEVKNIANNVVFHQILSMLPRVESVMLELKFGLYDKIYSTKEIAKLFNKSETDIIKIIRCALEDVKVLANPVSDEIIKLLNPINDTDLKLVLDKKED